MIKKLLTTSLVTATLLLSGCGSDSEGESRLETQQMLDAANYDGVISKLSSSALTNEENLALAAAYMGRAGLSLSDLITVVGDSGSDEDTDAFGSFIKSVGNATQGKSSALSDITNATKRYEKVLGEGTCNNESLTDSQADLCIFKGLTQTMGAATTMSYIAEDIGSVFSENAPTDYKLKASTCAMQYAINPLANISGCSITDNSTTLTFENNETYNNIYVSVNEDTTLASYEFLLTQAQISSTAVTNGFCTTTDFTTRVQDKTTLADTTGYHVCPVNEEINATEITTGSVIADALNNGIDSIGVAADEEMQNDINEFKADVLAASGKSGDAVITEEDIVNYLNKNNEE